MAMLPGARVAGADISPAMLKRAAARGYVACHVVDMNKPLGMFVTGRRETDASVCIRRHLAFALDPV